MKKGLIFGVLSMITVLASAKTFIDKTNLDQLNYRVLESGQVAWNEEDGSAVIYIGSPTAVQNIRVIDPTALRGYRYKVIDDELTFNACDRFVSSSTTNDTIFTYTSNSSLDTFSTEYVDFSNTGSGSVATNGTSYMGAHAWVTGIYTKSDDGTYTPVTLADGTILGGTNQVDKSIQYAYQRKFIRLTVEVIAKDSNIEELDFYFKQSEGTMGDMQPIETERDIVYNGRRATIEVRVLHLSGNGKTVTLSGFTAKCKGIGDVEQVNDLALNKIFIYDRLTDENGRTGKRIRGEEATGVASGFDLYELRYWAKHLYDGNRGEDWAKYRALSHVNMSNRWHRYVGNLAMGPTSGDGFAFAKKGVPYMEYVHNSDASLDGTPYEGVQVAFTDIDPASSDVGTVTLAIIIDVPEGSERPAMDRFILQWKNDLTYDLWTPINGVWTQTDSEGLEWTIEVPAAYATALNKAGFYRIYINANPTAHKLRVNAELQVVGSDGYMYKLSWPSGGGTVTATLVE